MNKKHHIKFIKCLSVPFQFSKKYSIILLFSGLLYGLFFNISTYFLSKTIDKLTSPIDWMQLLIPLSIYLICMGTMFFITNIQTFFEKNFKTLSYIHSKKSLCQKKYNMKYILNENNEILDNFHLLDDFDTSIVDYIKSLVFFVTLFFQLIFLFILISFYSINTAIYIFIFTTIILFLVIKGGNASYIASKKTQPLEREKKAIETSLIDFSYTEERSLFRFSKFLSERYASKATQSRKYTNNAIFVWFLKAQYGGVIFILLTVTVIFFLSTCLMRTEISFGMFVSLFSIFLQLSELMSWDLSDNVDSFIKSTLKVKDYLFILDLDNEVTNGTLPTSCSQCIECIQFKDVSFSYPNSNRFVLKHVNLQFIKGKKYALVGENGCGKTTLFKLLLGLYNDYSGLIYYDSSNSEHVSRETFLNNICVVLQDFSNYYIPIRDFLQLGTKKVHTETKIKEIFRILNIDIDLDTLSSGLDTPLGSILNDGTNISGGQWQKLCLARAALSEKEIIILDEPTSAIDPLSELKIMEIFNKLCQNKTIIYITHRLSTVKNSDIIYVIDNGEIVQKGNHINLIKAEGLYKKMFELQKSWYKNEIGGNQFEKQN